MTILNPSAKPSVQAESPISSPVEAKSPSASPASSPATAAEPRATRSPPADAGLFSPPRPSATVQQGSTDFRTPGAGRTIAELTRKLAHGQLRAHDLAQGLRAATFGRDDDFFRQLADLRDFVDRRPGALGERASKLFGQLQAQVHRAMDRGVLPNGSERRQLLSEIFGLVPGETRPMAGDSAARSSGRQPISAAEILIYRPGDAGLERVEIPTRLANRFGTDQLVQRLSQGEQPISGFDLAQGIVRTLAGRNREQLGGLQWANLRDGLEQSALELSPTAQRVVDRFRQLAGKLRDDGRVGATRGELSRLVQELEEVVDRPLRPRHDPQVTDARQRLESLPQPISGIDLAQVLYLGTRDRDRSFLAEFQEVRRGLRGLGSELGQRAQSVFEVFEKYAAETRRSNGDGLPRGRYESFLSELENAAGSNLLRFEKPDFESLPRPIAEPIFEPGSALSDGRLLPRFGERPAVRFGRVFRPRAAAADE